MKRLLFLLFIIRLSIIIQAQSNQWVDSTFRIVRNANYPSIDCVVREYKVFKKVVKQQNLEVSYNPDGNSVFLNFDYYGYNGNFNDKISYGWSICYDTLLLFNVSYSNNNKGIIEDYSFYQNTKKESNIGSVKIHTYYENGKKIRKEYAPGEKWADLPYDPDSLFFELPKLLQLGDSILYIKHKYPRPE